MKNSSSEESGFNLIDNWDIVEASLQQDYGIVVTTEWLESISVRKFVALLGGLTKDTAMGHYFLAKNIKKNKTLSGNNEKTFTFDVKNKKSMEMFSMFAKQFEKK